MFGFNFLSSLQMQLFSDPILDEDGFEHDGEGGWPFHNFVEQLIIDMFDPSKFVFLSTFLKCIAYYYFCFYIE